MIKYIIIITSLILSCTSSKIGLPKILLPITPNSYYFKDIRYDKVYLYAYEGDINKCHKRKHGVLILDTFINPCFVNKGVVNTYDSKYLMSIFADTMSYQGYGYSCSNSEYSFLFCYKNQAVGVIDISFECKNHHSIPIISSNEYAKYGFSDDATRRILNIINKYVDH